MSSEVCPFCGKTYKRLKSHLPHCKAAASSKTPPTKYDVTVNQISSSQLALESSKTTAESTQTLLSTGKQSKKSKKTTSSLSPASLPASTKKKTTKLTEQINISLTSSPSPPLSPTTSKPKKQSLRALIEATKSTQVSQGSLEETRFASEDQTPFVADPLSSRTTAETKTNPDKDSINSYTHPASLSTDTKPKAASKTKVKTKMKSAQSTTKETSKVDENSASKRDFGVENEVEDLTLNNILISGSGQSRVTLQDVKATLGRGNASRPSILSQIETSLSPLPLQKGTQALVKTEQRNSKQASLVPLQQLELTSPAAPPLSSQVSKATPPVSVTEGLKATGLVTTSPSLTKFSSPLMTARRETTRAEDGLKSQFNVRKENTADKGTTGAVTQRTLGQVRLKELPQWFICKTPSRPREVVDMVQRGWQWYYRRYIDVRKGGVGGLSMMLAGYCVLSYIWSYPHIKHDRWRKYH